MKPSKLLISSMNLKELVFKFNQVKTGKRPKNKEICRNLYLSSDSELDALIHAFFLTSQSRYFQNSSQI